jgi:hypothetical protein
MIVFCHKTSTGLCERTAMCEVVCVAKAAIVDLGAPLQSEPLPVAPINVVALFGNGANPAHSAALHAANEAIVAALDKAKAAGVAQGLIVALLHGHAARETSELW